MTQMVGNLGNQSLIGGAVKEDAQKIAAQIDDVLKDLKSLSNHFFTQVSQDSVASLQL